MSATNQDATLRTTDRAKWKETGKGETDWGGLGTLAPGRLQRTRPPGSGPTARNRQYCGPSSARLSSSPAKACSFSRSVRAAPGYTVLGLRRGYGRAKMNWRALRARYRVLNSHSAESRPKGLTARGKSRSGAKNGDCHQFAPRHGPRKRVRSLKRIGWLYPIFATFTSTAGLSDEQAPRLRA